LALKILHIRNKSDAKVTNKGVSKVSYPMSN